VIVGADEIVGRVEGEREGEEEGFELGKREGDTEGLAVGESVGLNGASRGSGKDSRRRFPTAKAKDAKKKEGHLWSQIEDIQSSPSVVKELKEKKQ
jgi:hypothetical protein